MSKPLICDDDALNDAPASYTSPSGERHVLPLSDPGSLLRGEIMKLVKTLGDVQQSQGRELDALWLALGMVWQKVAPGEPRPWP